VRTFSHFLMTAGLQRRFRRSGIPVHAKGFLLGSVLPDIPLFALTAGYVVYYRWIDPIPADLPFWTHYDPLFFRNPWWVALHSLFHAPLLIGLMIVLGLYGVHTRAKWGGFLLWLAWGCALHALIDIVTHHSDGPLIGFPLDWTYRFASPISYWEPAYYGRFFTVFEYLLDGWLLLTLLRGRIRSVFARARRQRGSPCGGLRHGG